MLDRAAHNVDTEHMMTVAQYALSVRQQPNLPALSEEDQAEALQLAARLIPTEDQLGEIVTFGSEVQSTLAQISKDMLAGVRVNALDEVMRLSQGVLGQVNTLNLDDLSPTARQMFVFLHESAADIKRRIENFFKGYQMVSTRLDRQEANIFAKEADSTQRFHLLIELEKALRQVMHDARIQHAAIEYFLASEYGHAEMVRRRECVQGEKSRAAIANRPIDLTLVATADRYAKYIERIEMKSASLQQAIASAYQTSIATRMMQENEIIIRQKLSDIRTDLLPQWRTLIAIAYNAYLQHGVAEFVKSLEAAEADLRRKTGDQLEMTAREMAGMMTRPMFDPESLQYYHQKLIHSLETLKAASLEAKNIREASEASMRQMMIGLGNAVTDITLREEQ